VETSRRAGSPPISQPIGDLDITSSLDDYYIVAVHPTTFGKGGYMPPEVVKYYRFGQHSAFFYITDEQALVRMAEDCRNGDFQPDAYRILQFFPNLLVAIARHRSVDTAMLQQFVPISHDRTAVFTVLRDPFINSGGRMATISWLALPVLRWLERWIVQRVLQEDRAVCEQMQSIVHQLDQPQMFGSQEQQVAWFEENYQEVVKERACLS